jgi:hypothetical protein
MLSQEELKKVIDEFVAIVPSSDRDDPTCLRRKELLEKYAGKYVEFDGRYNASQVDADCPWEILFTILSQFKIGLFLKFRVTDELFSHIGGYDEIRRAARYGYFECEGKYDKEANVVRIFTCVEQNYGDEDGFGVEPDTYAKATIDSNGVFIVPLHVDER